MVEDGAESVWVDVYAHVTRVRSSMLRPMEITRTGSGHTLPNTALRVLGNECE